MAVFADFTALRRVEQVAVLAKLAAVIFVIIAAPSAWSGEFLDRIREMHVNSAYFRMVKFATIFIPCLAVICLVPFIQATWARCLAGAAISIGFFVDQICLAIFGQHFDLDLSLLAWVDRANASVTLPAYAETLWACGVAGCVVFVVLTLRPPVALTRDSFVLPFVGFIFAGAALVLWSSKFKNYSLPAPVAWPAIAARTIELGTRDESRPRRAVDDVVPFVKRKFRHVVYIIDESVRGDRLTINDPKWDTTPFLASRGAEFVNFGDTTSAANCSNQSRMLLRFGVQPHQLPDPELRLMQKPTVWQYAKRAGYKTVHVDPFRLLGNFHSGMNMIEAKSIDESISVAKVPMSHQDQEIAKILVDLLKRDQPSFIYINKNGTHPLFSKQYPEGLEYEPTGLDTLPLNDAQRAEIRHYHRALKWSVDGFFKDTWSALTAPDVLTVYTSDHGLALFEGGFAATHCSMQQPAAGEGMVPLFVVSGDPAVARKFRNSADNSAHAASHFNVFPTFLWAFGFEARWIESQYGKPLTDPDRPRQRKFWSGPFGRDASAAWFDVDEQRERLLLAAAVAKEAHR